ncbi:MAG: 4Fe-4S binding protein [Clostridiales bacterium]|nr:4Fe-4S binding protein [Clostridiales bacterium]
MELVKRIKDRIRLWVQILFAALTNGYAIGFIKGKIFTGPSKAMCLPGLNCYSCPGSLGSCPIGSLQAVLGSKNYKFSFYIIGFIMLIGWLLGRFVCGWLCPFGLVQDLLYKIPVPFKRKNLPRHKWLIWVKYIVLALFVVALPLLATDFLGQGSPWFCKYICPSGTLFAGIPLVVANESLQGAIGLLFSWKVLVLAAVVIISIVIYRPFCKYLCPLGALYGLFNKISIYRLDVDKVKCTRCTKCQQVCKMDVPVYDKPNSMECIRCGDCIKACPENAIYSSLSNMNQGEKEND